MKDLLLKIRDELRAGIDAVRDTDIYLTPDPDLLPERVKLPCIGIKDGPVTRTDLVGGCVEKTLPVAVHVYVRLFKDEDSVLALVSLAEAVSEALADNLLGDYVRDMSSGDESPVSLMVLKDGLILRKTLNYAFVKEE